MSFMDGFSRYNQIKMALKDMTKTTFTIEWGIYCYTVMLFGLKNVGATYQRMATTLLHDMIHSEVEVYFDDMIVKSKDREGHITNLRKFFKKIKEYKFRLNLQKYTFGVIVGKLLGFLVSDRVIEVDLSKIKAILDMPPPKSEKKIRGFLGQLQYISQFIGKLDHLHLWTYLQTSEEERTPYMERRVSESFWTVKEYLFNLPILIPPEIGKPLLLYLSII